MAQNLFTPCCLETPSWEVEFKNSLKLKEARSASMLMCVASKLQEHLPLAQQASRVVD